MQPYRRLCLLALVFFLNCSCTKKTPNPVLLKVGSVSWNLASYKQILEAELKGLTNIEKKSKTDFQKIKEDLVQDLILRALIENWAKKNRAKGVSAKNLFKKKKGVYSGSASLKKLQAQQQQQKNLYDALLEHLSKKIPKPSRLQQKNYYLKNKKLFYKSSSCFLGQILVPSAGLAKKLLLQIKSGDSFDTLKFLHSSKSDVGWVEKGVLDIFDKACRFSLKSITPVLKSSYGYHIFKIVKKRGALQKKFPEVQKKILSILIEKPKKKAFQQWMEAEISKTPIFIDKNLLDKIHIQYKSNLL